MRVRVLVYKGFYATGPREVKNALKPYFPGILRLWLNHPEMTFNPKPQDVVINWGCIVAPTFWSPSTRWINPPHLVARNRLQNLKIMKEAGVNVPDFTTKADEASQWLADGKSVLCRQSLRSFGGNGIEVADPNSGGLVAPNAALYTKYRPKRHEYRVHVLGGKVIDVQQKRRRQGDLPEGVESKVRSYANGWVFTREGVHAPDSVRDSALQAVQALGLDFAAVDVGWTEKGDIATVYECNTAPGIEGTTVTKYANALREHIHELG